MKDITNRNENFGLEDMIDDMFKPVFFSKKEGMKTDVKEDDKQIELDIDMPGFKKEEINIDLSNGYLNVSAKKEQKQENSNENKGNYVRRERSFYASRSYYVGDKVKEEEIKAKYENGVLNLLIPKEQPKELPEHKIHID